MVIAQAPQVAATHPSWPEGAVAPCACPHCGHFDKVQISNARAWHLEFRDGECSECGGEYIVVPVGDAVAAEKLPRDAQSYLIQHNNDVGDQGVSVMAPVNLDVRRAAIYMEFWAEEWFGDEKYVTNLGIAAALVTFYGCKHSPMNSRGNVIDMHHDREAMCRDASMLMADTSLNREGLREFLSAHICG